MHSALALSDNACDAVQARFGLFAGMESPMDAAVTDSTHPISIGRDSLPGCRSSGRGPRQERAASFEDERPAVST